MGDLLAKLSQWIWSLTVGERWTLLGFVIPLAGGIFALVKLSHRIGWKGGRDFEIKHGQVPGLLLRNEDLGRENIKLDGEVRRLADRGQTLAINSEAQRRTDIDPPAEIQDLLRMRQDIVSGRGHPWQLRDAQPLADLRKRLEASPLKILTVGNLKGGVGKTTIAANLAAFFDIRFGHRVLVVDLDYQGSASATMLQAAGKTLEFSIAEHLLSGAGTAQSLIGMAKDLSPALARTRIIPAGYTLQDAEDDLMLRWLFNTTERDVRFNLAEFLLSPDVQSRFDLAILDVGPRLTTASLSAICASTHLLVPSNLDKLSAETVGSFLRQVKRIRTDLQLAVELAGVVGTMSMAEKLKPQEMDALGTLRESVAKEWPGGTVLARTLPRMAALANVAGNGIGYLAKGGDGKKVKTVFDALGHEVATRMGVRAKDVA